MPDAQYERTRDAWRAIWAGTDVAREWDTREYPRSRATRARFLPYLPADAPVLEAGCGLGAELLGLADPYQAVGVDYVVAPLQRLKARRADLRLAAADIHALPFRDGTFGAYLSFGVLEHFAFGPLPALREAARVLRPGGVLVLTIPAPNLVWRLARVTRRFRRPAEDDAPHYYETTYSARVLRRVVSEAGFAVQECHPIGHDFVLWGCGGPFRADGYYRTTALAEQLGRVLSHVLPHAMGFATLIIARRRRTP